jgi:uncharacterized protein YndB with AHSA1/START domain
MKTKLAAKKSGVPTKAQSGDAAVLSRTGKTWDQWFGILDQAGAVKMKHAEIARYVYEKHSEVGGWWSQMITVSYEQARGMREKHQKPSGYEISVSRTIAVPLKKSYEAWSNSRTRSRWLPEKNAKIRKATENKTIRITWPDETSLLVSFLEKGKDKSQVVVTHAKLKNSAGANRMKKYWSERLDQLKSVLES